MRHHDAIVIGTRQSGPALTRRLVAAGQKVAVIERKFFGGTCVNTGCTPTKALVASAYAAFLARRASDYGVTIGGQVGIDMHAVKARKDAIVAPSRRGVERSLRNLEGCTVYEGHARFVADKKVAVNGFELGADRIFINVGGRASIPPIPGLDQVPHFTNSSIMDVDFLPAHLIILGGSYIGLEFAQVYRRFGSEVTVIELAPWDGGILSNTPTEPIFDDNPRRNCLVFAVHMWNPMGAEPETIWEVLHRQKDIQYSSRVANHIAKQRQVHKLRHVVSELVKFIPEEKRDHPVVKDLAEYGCRTQMHVVQLLAPRLDNENHTKDIDFSPSGIRSRWEAGYAHTMRALEQRAWENACDPLEGVVLHETEHA